MTSEVTATAASDLNEIVPRRIKILWSTGALGVHFMMNTVAGFALLYMVTVLKIEHGIAGAVAFFP